jgi:hypothetical protein
MDEIPRKYVTVYEGGPHIEVVEGHAVDHLEKELKAAQEMVERLNSIIESLPCEYIPERYWEDK